MIEIQTIMKVYNFKIDAYHIPIDYKNWEETLSVELTDNEFKALCKVHKKCMKTGEWYRIFPEVDEEYLLKKYCPKILNKVRQTLSKKAYQIWDDRIIPHIDKIGIYIPEEVWNVNRVRFINENND